jgi:hypothetical protein
VKGVGDSLQRLLKVHGLNPRLPVIVDEMGLAEPSTIEDLSDLRGAMQKEAAMAAFTTALQEYYEQEPGNWLPISGAGWHFALLTYGKQSILSTYAKGLLLRNQLGDRKIPVKSAPVDAQGYGLHAIATKENNRISILLYAASPSIFYSQAEPLNYTGIELVLKDLPAEFRNKKLTVTQWYSTPEDSVYQRILSQDKYQTLPLKTGVVTANKSSLTLPVDLDAYGMRLIQIEIAPQGGSPF